MAGCALSLLRMVRLRPALESTITSTEFTSAKPKVSFMKYFLFCKTQTHVLTNNAQLPKGILNIIKSERFWNHLKLFLRAIYPALLVLRLADSNKPCMDKLYHYVRRMDETLKKSKELLDNAEKEVLKEYSTKKNDVEAKMISYFLVSTSTDGVLDLKLCEEDMESDEEENVSEDKADDDSFDEETSQNLLNSNSTLGDKVIDFWKKRRQKLCHDVAMTGWMLSPDPEIRVTIDQHTAEHVYAVERLLTKWYKHEVYILLFMFLLF
jgi:hypothetical protein